MNTAGQKIRVVHACSAAVYRIANYMNGRKYDNALLSFSSF